MNNSIEIYRSQDGSIQLNVKLENDTVWLTQSQMAELFGVDRTSIVRHIRNIYKSEELDQNSTCAKNAQVRTEVHRSILREIPYYNLDMIKSSAEASGLLTRRTIPLRVVSGKSIRHLEAKTSIRQLRKRQPCSFTLHSFSDGNKRIAAMLFLWFLNNNHVLYAEDGHKRIADNTLVALTLMIAESRTEEKDVMVKVVVNLINKENQ